MEVQVGDGKGGNSEGATAYMRAEERTVELMQTLLRSAPCILQETRRVAVVGSSGTVVWNGTKGN